MGLAKYIKTKEKAGRQEECLALVTRLLRRKFGIQSGRLGNIFLLPDIPGELSGTMKLCPTTMLWL
jgi:hypothetical protein